MFKKGKIMLSILLASVFILSSSMSAFASSSTNLESERLPQQQSQQSALSNNNDKVEPLGIKKWIAKTALKAVSKALRSGGKLIDDIAESLGGKEATYFTKNTDTIADALDDLVARGDVIEDAIIDTVSTALISAGVPSGAARTIASVFTFLAF